LHIRRFYPIASLFLARCQNFRKKKKKEKNSLFVTFTRTNFTFIITKRRYVVYNNNNNNTRALVFVRSHAPIRIRVIDSRGVSLSLSFTLAIGVIYTAYKKREQLSHREKINTTRAKIIATTAPNASVARTF
jgi:hypothetical protein